MLLHAVDSDDSKTRMTDEQARDEAMVLFLAGHDTTAAGLIWFWYIMGKYPEIQQRVHDEIECVLGKHSPGFADVAKLPYLSIVYAFSYVTHRDQRWFPDPERFDPERFLGEKERKFSPFAYFPFGAGPRACIGAQFALTEITLVAACLLRRFEFSLRPRDSDPEPFTHLSLRPRSGLVMVLKKRHDS